jgi:hypothetical protein
MFHTKMMIQTLLCLLQNDNKNFCLSPAKEENAQYLIKIPGKQEDANPIFNTTS